MIDLPATLLIGDPLDPPAPSHTIPDFIRLRARIRPAATAIVDAITGRSIDYGTLDRLIGRCAAGLAARGLRSGDTLLVFSPDSPEWVIVALGAMTAGGRVTGANPNYTVAELRHQLSDSGSRFAFTLPALLCGTSHRRSRSCRRGTARAWCRPRAVTRCASSASRWGPVCVASC